MQLFGCNIGRLKYLYFFKYWSLTLLTHLLTRMFLISYELLKYSSKLDGLSNYNSECRTSYMYHLLFKANLIHVFGS